MTEIDILEQQAIDAAIAADWERAIELNKKIFKADKQNLGAILRLGFASIQVSGLEEAKKYYKKALKLQPSNLLAHENLERISILENNKKKKGVGIGRAANFDPNLFLETPGRTKSITLVNLGQKEALAHLVVAEEIYLKPRRHKIEIRTLNDEYIGSLPDDLSKRLMLFIKAESSYKAYIKDVSLSRVIVFIREVKKGRKVANFTSFPKDTHHNLMNLETAEDGKIVPLEGEAEHDEDDHLEFERLAESLGNEDKQDVIEFHQSDEVEDEENLEE